MVDPQGSAAVSILDLYRYDGGSGMGGGAVVGTIAVGTVAIGTLAGAATVGINDELTRVGKVAKGKTQKQPSEVHHIVARTSFRALPARLVLEAVFPDGVNNPNNLVSVNYSFHRRLHTNEYYGCVNFIITWAYITALGDPEAQKQNVSNALDMIRALIEAAGGQS